MGCPHAIGFSQDKIFYFNEENINTIAFRGFVDDIEKEMNELNEKVIRTTVMKKFRIGN